MSTYLKFAGLGGARLPDRELRDTNSQARKKTPTAYGNRISNVRTTAYTHTEEGGRTQRDRANRYPARTI